MFTMEFLSKIRLHCLLKIGFDNEDISNLDYIMLLKKKKNAIIMNEKGKRKRDGVMLTTTLVSGPSYLKSC